MPGALLDQIRIALRQISSADQSARLICCPECGASASLAEILNNQSRCQTCGTFLDVDALPKEHT